MPPLPSLTSTYHTPAVVGFMNNTNIAVSSLRTAIDESDGEPETDTDMEPRGVHDIRSLYSFSRELDKHSFRDSACAAREAGRAGQMSGEVENENVGHSARGKQGINEGDTQTKSEVSGSSPEPGISPAEEVGEHPTDIPSAAPSPPPSAVSVH